MKKDWLSEVIRFDLRPTTYRYAVALRLLAVDNEVHNTSSEISYVLGLRPEQTCRSRKELADVGLIEEAVHPSGKRFIILTTHRVGTIGENIYNIYNYINNNIENKTKGGMQGGKKVATPKKEKRTLAQIKKELPEWVDPETWDQYVEMRQRIRKPLTAYAGELVIRDLKKFREMGQDPNENLRQSIKNSWQGVFALKDVSSRSGVSDGKQSINDLVAKLEEL